MTDHTPGDPLLGLTTASLLGAILIACGCWVGGCGFDDRLDGSDRKASTIQTWPSEADSDSGY